MGEQADTDIAVDAAFMAAGAAFGVVLPEAWENSSLEAWPYVDGVDPDIEEHEEGHAALELAYFVRNWPEAPPEALYRRAVAKGIARTGDADAWLSIHRAHRLAYLVFRATLILVDAELREEAAREAAATRKAPAPVVIRAEDTILEQHGALLERHDDPPKMVTLGGRDGAESVSGSTVVGLDHADQTGWPEPDHGQGGDGATVSGARARSGEGDADPLQDGRGPPNTGHSPEDQARPAVTQDDAEAHPAEAPETAASAGNAPTAKPLKAKAKKG